MEPLVAGTNKTIKKVSLAFLRGACQIFLFGAYQ